MEQLRFPFPPVPVVIFFDREEWEESSSSDRLDDSDFEEDPDWRETCGRCGADAEWVAWQSHGQVWRCPDPACGERWARGLEI